MNSHRKPGGRPATPPLARRRLKAAANLPNSSPPAPFAFRTGEGVKQGFIRILGELKAATARLETQGPADPEAIHGARLLVKRLRALLWFARPAFTSIDGRWAKGQLQLAAHLLSAQRDAAVVQTMLGLPSPRPGTLAPAAPPTDLAPATSCAPGGAENSLPMAVMMLRKTIQRLLHRAPRASLWPESSARLAKASSAMAKAGRQALHTRKSSHWHDWRKKAKRLLYLLQLTQVVPDWRKRYALAGVDHLQERLGDYHDCVIARASLQDGLGKVFSPKSVRRSLGKLKARQRELRRKVRKSFRRLKEG